MSAIAAAGISVSPAVEQLTLNAQQTSYSFTAYAANNTDHPVTLALDPVDFSPSGVTGGIAFAGSIADSLNNPHGLASWIKITPAQITLLPKGNQAFKVNLNGTNSLTPGGHYAAIVLKLVNNSNQPIANRVQINQEISMLLFTATNGSGTRGLNLQPVGPGIAWFHMPQTLNLFLTNNGNTQATPRGYVTMFNSHNKPVSRSIVNSGSALVLPGGTRLMQTPTNARLQPFWPGVYHLQVAYNYDGAVKLSYYDKNFVYVSLPFVIIVAAVVVLLLALQFLRRRLSRRYRARN